MNTPAANTPTKPTPTTKRKPRRPKVIHFFWTSSAEAARELGISETLSICRRAWVRCVNQKVNTSPSKTTWGKVDRDLPRGYCKVCARMADAYFAKLGWK